MSFDLKPRDGSGMSLAVVGEEGGQQETAERLAMFARRKKALSKKLSQLQSQLENIHSEEVGIIGDDMDSLVKELGDDVDLKEILDSIVLGRDEIKGIEGSIEEITAQAVVLEKEGADFKARYASERRVTNKMELLLASQKNELQQEQSTIRDLLARIKEVRTAKRSETEEGISQALETPMQAACATIVDLLTSAEEKGEIGVAMPLSKVLKQISAANLYTSRFRFDDDTDDDTRKWIAETFMTSFEKIGAGASTASTPSEPRPASPKAIQSAAKDLPQLYFNQFSHKDDEFVGLIKAMFEDFGIFAEFGVELPVFNGFMHAMQESYKSENPYHNYRHAFDVTQMSYYFVKQTSAASILTNWDIFLLIICCIAHDLDHNGYNNLFHINSQSPLAMIYNDASVMENHHSSLLLKVLGRSETNLLANVDEKQKMEAKQKMVQIILSTDMSSHFDVTNKFKLKVDSGVFGEKDAETGVASEEDRTILQNLLMHASDLSNAARPFPIARRWAYDIIEEFSAQGDLEAELQLPISPMCLRSDFPDDVTKAKMQLGFLDFVVAPMFKGMAAWMTGMQMCLDNLAANRAIYASIKDEEVSLEEAEAKAGAEAEARAEAARAVAEGAGLPAEGGGGAAVGGAAGIDEDDDDGDDV